MASILIVDDSWIARLGLSKMLKTVGHTISEVENGTEALALLEKQSFDLLFLDLLMPGLEGPEVLKILQEKNSIIPIIVLSADIQETTRKLCFQLGAKGFLKKPPRKEDLEKLLREVL